MPSLLTLTTDFGAGPYVAQVKGVILSLFPDLVIVDVSHEVAPGDVHEAAYFLETIVPAFPEATVHLVVVAPGVGTDRRILAARFAGRIVLGPDNGVLSTGLPGADEIRVVTNERLFLPEVSATFHGRDVFAPVAAHLAAGAELEVVGPVLTDAPVLLSDLIADGDSGRVLSIDRFGNVITSFPAEALAARPGAALLGGSAAVAARAETFGAAPPETPFLYSGSGGRLEVAVRGGHAAERLGLSRGTGLTFTEAPE